MEAPTCSVCLQKHFGSDHIWPKEKKAEAGQVEISVGSTQVAPDTTTKDSKPSPESVSAPFDRKTYQREYMRKYRAKIALNRLKP